MLGLLLLCEIESDPLFLSLSAAASKLLKLKCSEYPFRRFTIIWWCHSSVFKSLIRRCDESYQYSTVGKKRPTKSSLEERGQARPCRAVL